ncbi:MAG: hypothetical protein U0Y68_09860 [Blastocatellia bacterium]
MTGASAQFMDVVKSLRSADDHYSLLVQGGPQHGLRIVLNEPELLIGWARDGQHLAFAKDEIAVPCVYLKKDWHGVSAQYLQAKKNAAELQAKGQPFRLQQGSKLDVGLPPNTKRKDSSEAVFLLLQEPAALQSLDSIVPQGLPEPVNPTPSQPQTITPSQIVLAPPSPPAPPRRWFGYFSTAEIACFALGTLLLTALLFLLLSYL